jgi:hypothetical protein|tara:strand:+ start:2102 stop:2464 length:363 start_codon:yes stop_codon:yes gene_type:complete
MIIELIIAALATWEIIEIWHHSLLFAPLRARTELWTNKLGELIGCPFCLAPWVALLSVMVLFSPEWFGWSVWSGLRVIWYSFAVARLANLGNDYFKATCRTPTPYDGLLDYPNEDETSGD